MKSRQQTISPTFRQLYRQVEKEQQLFKKARPLPLSPSPKNRSLTKDPPKSKIDRLISNIYFKHQEMKNHIQNLKEAKYAEEEKQFQKLTFSPKISHSQRFKSKGTFQGRQQSLIDDRKEFLEKSLEKKQRLEMTGCPFKPTLISKKSSQFVLKRKEVKIERARLERDLNKTSQEIGFQQDKWSASKSPTRERKSLSSMKNLIKYQLNKINILE